MLSRLSGLLVALNILQSAAGLQVTPNSPCSSVCVDSTGSDFADPNSSNTKNKDIVCYDSEYQSSPAGQKFEQCMTCLQDSKYAQGGESDQLWFLYNMRYALDYCIFGFPNATNVASTPCSTERACGLLQDALTGDLLAETKKSDYAFCDADGGVMRSGQVDKCHACVSASDDQDFLANYVVALGAGCQQKPAPGVLIGLTGTVFTTGAIDATDPSTSSTEHGSSPLSTPMLIGIAIGGAVVLALVAGLVFVCCRRRRNARRVRLGDNPRPDRIASRDFPISPLSFRCQTHIASQESLAYQNSMSPNMTVEEIKAAGQSPIDFTHTATPEIVEASAFEKPNYGGWQPELPRSRNPGLPSDKMRRATHASLNSITTTAMTTTTTAAGSSTTTPTIPGNVHYAWSPQTTRFSPVSPDDIASPQSTTSTTALLPLKPYNPAEWGGSPVVSQGQGFMTTTPTSGVTASPPLLGRGWGEPTPRNASVPVSTYPPTGRQLIQPSSSSSPQPQQQQQQEPTRKETWGAGDLLLLPNPTLRKTSSNNTLNSNKSASSPVEKTDFATSISVSRTGSPHSVAIPPPKRRSSRAPPKPRYAGGVSPIVEDSSIKTVFPGPPRR